MALRPSLAWHWADLSQIGCSENLPPIRQRKGGPYGTPHLEPVSALADLLRRHLRGQLRRHVAAAPVYSPGHLESGGFWDLAAVLLCQPVPLGGEPGALAAA